MPVDHQPQAPAPKNWVRTTARLAPRSAAWSARASPSGSAEPSRSAAAAASSGVPEGPPAAAVPAGQREQRSPGGPSHGDHGRWPSEKPNQVVDDGQRVHIGRKLPHPVAGDARRGSLVAGPGRGVAGSNFSESREAALA